MKSSFGNICRLWRQQRRYSQLQLALELGVSSRHISFLETGRSTPSREMVLKIGHFLHLPKREINRGLYSAGYAPVYTELPYEHEGLRHVFIAIDHMLANHMPYPAMVLNQNWDVVKSNEAAQKLLASIGFSEHQNLVEALIDDDPATSKIINWHESAYVVLVRLRHEISMLGGSERLEELEQQLSLCIDFEDDHLSVCPSQPVLSINLQLPNDVLSFFSIISQLSTVQDIVISEFKVELMFPTNTVTENYYKTLT